MGWAGAARVASFVAVVCGAVLLAHPPPGPIEPGVSSYDIDPFSVNVAEKVALLAEWSAGLLAHDRIDHVDASLYQVKECKFYSDGVDHGHPAAGPAAPASDRGGPRGGWPVRDHADTGATCRAWLRIPDQRPHPRRTGRAAGPARREAGRPGVQAGHYDLVIDPSNLWLTIHESIGHATELDRALGYEAAYAGTSFATLDKLGRLQYGSPVMHVTGDRTVERGLATIGYDNEGVATQSWDLISGGVLTAYQLDRRIARLTGLGRSWRF